MKYHIQNNGAVQGPYSQTELFDMLEHDEITFLTPAWREGDPEWATVSSLLGLSVSPPLPNVDSVFPPPQCSDFAPILTSSSHEPAYTISRKKQILGCFFLFVSIICCIIGYGHTNPSDLEESLKEHADETKETARKVMNFATAYNDLAGLEGRAQMNDKHEQWGELVSHSNNTYLRHKEGRERKMALYLIIGVVVGIAGLILCVSVPVIVPISQHPDLTKS